MKSLRYFTYTLVIIGAFNWGFVGLLNFDIVAFIFGDMTAFTRVIYSLVGLAGIIDLILVSSGSRMTKSTAH